jgi:hypothetical protein
MSTKYNIITKITYKDFCEKTTDIKIVENDFEKRMVTLIDKFGNKCRIDFNENDTIIALTRIRGNDPVYMLYLLVTLADAKFLSEDDFKNCIQVPLMNEPDCKMVKITNGTYEEFTQYFLDYVKFERDFKKEYQILLDALQNNSSRILNKSHSSKKENNNNFNS